jgi:hypothetical protein
MGTYNETPGAGFLLLRLCIVSVFELPETFLLKRFLVLGRGGGYLSTLSMDRLYSVEWMDDG